MPLGPELAGDGADDAQHDQQAEQVDDLRVGGAVHGAALQRRRRAVLHQLRLVARVDGRAEHPRGVLQLGATQQQLLRPQRDRADGTGGGGVRGSQGRGSARRVTRRQCVQGQIVVCGNSVVKWY